MRKIAARLALLGTIAAAGYFVVTQYDPQLPFLETSSGTVQDSRDNIPATAKPDEPDEPDEAEVSGLAQEDGQAYATADRSAEREAVADDPYHSLRLKLSEGFRSRDGKFSVSHTGDRDELSSNMTEIIRAALRLDDYSAYVLESYMYTIRSWGSKSTIAVEARYRESVEETAAVERKVESVLAEIIRPGMNDHEKIKAIHDWIVTHVEYDQSLTYYTAYDAITLGRAVCQGYSLLGYMLLDKAGFDVLIAEGSVDTGEHAWNMVLLDGEWYHIDFTWDDPVGVKDDKIRYNYYLRTDEEMRVDHQWTRTYPAATKPYRDTLRELESNASGDEALRFAKLKIALGLHWLEDEHTIADEIRLREAVRAAVRTRTNLLEFRYLDGEGFPDALKAAFHDIGVAVGYRASYEPFVGKDWLLVNIHLEYS